MKTFRRGQSMMEILVSIAVMVIGVAASSAMMIATERSAVGMMNETRAVALAEEGAQAAISICDRSWTDLALGTHGLAIQAAPAMWVLQGSSDVADGYTRTIIVSEIDVHTKKAVITVSWSPGGGRVATVENQILLTDWSAI